jgi:hypothetical protein
MWNRVFKVVKISGTRVYLTYSHLAKMTVLDIGAKSNEWVEIIIE